MKFRYEKPQLYRLDERAESAYGANCAPTGSNATNNCDPTGNGADERCLTGSGAITRCQTGNGDATRCQGSGISAAGTCQTTGTGVV